jgi:hypothetical protein
MHVQCRGGLTANQRFKGKLLQGIAAYREVELCMGTLSGARAAAAVQRQLQQLEEECPQLYCLNSQAGTPRLQLHPKLSNSNQVVSCDGQACACKLDGGLKTPLSTCAHRYWQHCDRHILRLALEQHTGKPSSLS